jgi:DNA-binding CsgD family transcriptional regulator
MHPGLPAQTGRIQAAAGETPWAAIAHGLAPPERAQTTGLAALDGVATGVVVVDGELTVILANIAAEDLALQGLGFVLAHGGPGPAAATRLLATRREERDALHRLVRGVALSGEAGGALRLSDADAAASLAVLVAPLPARLAESPMAPAGRVPGQALLLLRELGPATAPRAAVLRELFGLTAAEAEVARALAGGASKSAVAAARGAAETTVRSQVRSVLAKTGAANLRDLERMLAGLAGL